MFYQTELQSTELVVGGMQAVADTLAQQLGKKDVRLETPALRVQQDKDSVIVIGQALAVKARRVIIAVPPNLAARIEYEPSLPALKAQLLDRSPAGQGIKWHAVYPEPFWRNNGFTGQGANLNEIAPQECLDCTPPEGKPGVLAGFAFGPTARQLATLSIQERRQIWLNGLVKRFGSLAEQPTYIDEYDWSTDTWARGDMFAHYAPGVLTGFGGALRVPCGRIHWAGTETATIWSGSIEGAFRSGERAADEVSQQD